MRFNRLPMTVVTAVIRFSPRSHTPRGNAPADAPTPVMAKAEKGCPASTRICFHSSCFFLVVPFLFLFNPMVKPRPSIIAKNASLLGPRPISSVKPIFRSFLLYFSHLGRTRIVFGYKSFFEIEQLLPRILFPVQRHPPVGISDLP